MKSVEIVVATLKANAPLVALVDDQIYGVNVPIDAPIPHIIVHLIYDDEEVLLQGATQWPQARVSIESRGNTVKEMSSVSNAVNDWLRDKHLYQIIGYETTIRKEGTDATDSSSQTAGTAGPDVTRRIVDYYVRYRAIP